MDESKTKDMLIADAIETAIHSSYRIIKLERIVKVSAVLNVVLACICIGLVIF